MVYGIKDIFGLKCPGCGMIKAAFYQLHGDFMSAFASNKLMVLVFHLPNHIYLQ